jgi:hypothetical protein
MVVRSCLRLAHAAIRSLHRGRRQRPLSRRLCLEQLEERSVPTVTAVNETFTTSPNLNATLNVVDQDVLDQGGTNDSSVTLAQVGPISPSGAGLTPDYEGGTVGFASANTGTYQFNYNLDQAAQQVTASDGTANDLFGASVAIDGNTAVVGAPDHGNGGTVYVFTLSGSTWTQQAELTAADAASGDSFGVSVAISGTTIAVGDGNHKVGNNAAQGAVYVFTQNGTTWSQQQELTASDGAANDRFGLSVALDGTTLVVGSDAHQVGSNAAQGAAYVFTSSNSTWTQQQELIASDGAANDEFGSSVAISGTTIVVGAPDHEVGTNATQGAAYVFAQSGTTWTQQQELADSKGVAHDQFGTSVAISGTTVLVGAPNHYDGLEAGLSYPGDGLLPQGVVYVFTQSGTTWTLQQELIASDARGLGGSVAISGNSAVVGESSLGVNNSQTQGAAYVFAYSGTLWSQQQEIVPPLGALSTEEADLGGSVAVSGAFVLAGGEGEAFGGNGQFNSGVAQGGVAFQTTAISTAMVTVQVVNPVSAPQTVGVFDPATATWYLNGSNAAGAPTAGEFQYGAPGWIALTGDFTGDGQDTLVVVDPTTETWYISNNLAGGPPSLLPFQYGAPGWIPVVGDWNGSGIDGIGVVDPTTGTWYLRNEVSAGPADAGLGAPQAGFHNLSFPGPFAYGAPGWIPVVGNWAGNADGEDGIGMVDPSTETWYLRDTPSFGAVSYTQFQYGAPGWTPVVGNWTGTNQTEIGVYDSTGTFYLPNETSAGSPNAVQFTYGAGGWMPLAGQWTSPLEKQFAAGIGPGAPSISNAVLQSTVQEALGLLTSAGVYPALVQQLASANYVVSALPPGVLGETFVATNTVLISADASGYGWYTDTSPQDPVFGSNGIAAADSAAASEEDLLTTVLHEMGHLAGQPDISNVSTGPTLMDAVLPLGVRRIDTLDQVFANGSFV